MTQASIGSLPVSPQNKSGWPWTEESKPLPEKMPDGRSWPKISIVTPSYNQGEFLEETIRSILLQNYPNLEYIIIDGGSADNSVEIIKKYEPWLTYWVSEKDDGQADAVNKGLTQSTGEIKGWLNSDDYYEREIFSKVASEIDARRNKYILHGVTRAIDKDGNKIRVWHTRTANFYSLISQYRLCQIGGLVYMPNQPSVFWHKKVYENIGSLNKELKYVMDYEYWMRMLKRGYRFYAIDQIISNYRFHGAAKNPDGWKNCLMGWKQIGGKYFSELPLIKKFFVKFYLYLYLMPLSFITLPYRGVSYVFGVKRG